MTSEKKRPVQENGLSVEMIACGHGNAMPFSQFAYVLGK
jgi:hypothetical protein